MVCPLLEDKVLVQLMIHFKRLFTGAVIMFFFVLGFYLANNHWDIVSKILIVLAVPVFAYWIGYMATKRHIG